MTRPSRKPVIGLVMGDAAGIAPELIIKAFENEALTSTCSPFVIGNTSIMKLAASTMGRRLDFCPLKSVADIQPHATAIPILKVERRISNGFCGFIAAGMPFRISEGLIWA